jgi:predicted flavoprotein YhiN
LDWEAPTGGYLLTGVMGQGKQAGEALVNFLQTEEDDKSL